MSEMKAAVPVTILMKINNPPMCNVSFLNGSLLASASRGPASGDGLVQSFQQPFEFGLAMRPAL